LQQGNRLAAQHDKDDPKKVFKPSEFSMVLYSKFGKLLATKFDEDFTYGSLNDDYSLDVGDYVILVDPKWHGTVDNDIRYRHIFLSVFCG
jgi:hypothetical protein